MILLAKEVGASNVANLAQNVDDRTCDSLLLRCIVQNRGRPAVDQTIRSKTAADVKEGCEVPCGLAEGRNGDDETNYRGAHRRSDV